MLTDTHAHLDYPEFADLPAVIARAREAGITRLVSIGTSLESSRRAVALAEQHPEIRAVVGIHPNMAHEALPGDLPALRELAAHPRVVAIGEAGLDYYRLPEDQDHAALMARQAEIFQAQLELAAELRLNVVVHQRQAWEDCLRLLRPFSSRLRAVYHCFGETPERAGELFALGHLISFTGLVTFKNAPLVHASVRAVPADRYMVETDCPYLAPVPYRGKRCEPAYVREIAAEVARLRGVPLAQVAAETEETAERFFRFR